MVEDPEERNDVSETEIARCGLVYEIAHFLH